MDQLTLNFEPGLSSMYDTCREYIQVCIIKSGKQMKYVAADLNMSPSSLSRKLAQNEGDNSRFTLDDFESYIETSGDVQPLIYLLEKYLADTKQSQIEKLEAQLAQLTKGER